ncbi:MAG TPA: TIGR03089 family protein [Pseudonocardiaceae bacterium]
MTITDALLGPLLKADPARPLITHYDGRYGSRAELSRATVANWAAKTANWLCDELDVEPGTRVAVVLPPHWQTVGVLLGAWWCGAEITDDPAGAAVAFVGPDASADGAGADLVAAVALDPLGRGLTDPPEGTVDYIGAARVHGDRFTPLFPVDGATPALLGTTVDELVAQARRRAEELGATDGERVLCTGEWSPAGGVVDRLLAPLAVGGSVVQVTGSVTEAELAERATVERVTATLDVTVPGVRRLG